MRFLSIASLVTLAAAANTCPITSANTATSTGTTSSYVTGYLCPQTCNAKLDNIADAYISSSTTDTSTNNLCMTASIPSTDTTGAVKMSSTLSSATTCGSTNNWYYWSNWTYNPITGKTATTLYTNTCPHAAAGAGTVTCTIQVIPDASITSQPAPTPHSTIGYSMWGVNIYGPWEAGFTAGTFGTSGTNCYKNAFCNAGYEVTMCNQNVQLMCPVEYSNTYSLLGACGGHGTPYHYHQDLSCDYAANGAFASTATVSASSSVTQLSSTAPTSMLVTALTAPEASFNYYGIGAKYTSTSPVTTLTSTVFSPTLKTYTYTYTTTATYTATSGNCNQQTGVCATTTIPTGNCHSPKIGVSLDGYLIYGEEESGSYSSSTGLCTSTLASTDLDECGGHYGITPDSNGNYVYHYHTQSVFPFTIGCFGPAYPWKPMPSLTTAITASTLSTVKYSPTTYVTGSLAGDKQAQCLALFPCSCGKWYTQYATAASGQAQSTAAAQSDWTGSTVNVTGGVTWGCWDSYCPCGVYSAPTTTTGPSGTTQAVTAYTYYQTGVTASMCTSAGGSALANTDGSQAGVGVGGDLPVGAILGGVVGCIAIVALVGVVIKRKMKSTASFGSTELPTKL